MVPESQTESQTFSLRINTFPGIDIKQREVAEHLASGLPDAVGERGGSHLAIHQHGDVPAHFRKARQRLAARQPTLAHRFQIQLGLVDARARLLDASADLARAVGLTTPDALSGPSR